MLVRTAVVHKADQQTPLGLSVKAASDLGGIPVITRLDGAGMCAQSAFAAGILSQSIGDRILTVNGAACTTAHDFVAMVKAAPTGQLTLQVAPTSVVVASGTKSQESQMVGFSMVKAGNGGVAAGILQVSKIAPEGLFTQSPLRVGMNLLAINDQDVGQLGGGIREAIAIIQSIPVGMPINVIAVDHHADTRIPRQAKRWSYSKHMESEASGRIVDNPNPPEKAGPNKKRFSFTNMDLNNRRNSLV